ncbi:hypothetical protein [Candidatus Puniceispirillum marinum]|uniref:Putative sensor histidine kinase protein n=1 Tax=Puniceispirillum marinum (strain IMCC1322) TaxID=488538 RepID=D5BT04_PUNMI|nr:hypothetical protein [Candidatus Puniceispirillum marinum]ADE39401.1 putative sensor histidine kinase protein [Candidatus Puniceispirillum marinum IMCC1322]
MAKQKNIEIIAINLPAGEEELIIAAAHYFADRLLTPKQQKAITLLIDVANRPIRMPLTRDMLSERPGVFGATLPSAFEMSVSTAAGVKDALEVIAHEIVHLSQVLNRRLRMRTCTVKSDKVRHMSHSVSWLGDKFPLLDEFPWHLRPWEIEACQWQTILVNEFIARMTGANPQIVTQRGHNNQLALLNVRPSAIKAPPQSPSLSSATAIAETVLPIIERTPSVSASKESVSVPKENATSIGNETDEDITGSDVQPSEASDHKHKDNAPIADELSTGDGEPVSNAPIDNANDKVIETSPPIYTVGGSMINGHQTGHQTGHHGKTLNGDAHRYLNGTAHEASNDGENTAIQIRVDGLAAPRLLSRGALNSKLDDLLARGLIAPEDAKAAQTSLTSTDD